MFSEPDDRLFPGIWGEMSNRLSPNFRVHWIKQCSSPFGHAAHIKNPQNDDLPVMRCRDGQELPSSVGERLCRFLWQQSSVDPLRGTDLEFEPRVNYLMNDAPLPAPRDNGFCNGVESNRPPELSAKAAAGPVLALEDAKKDGGEPDDMRARPAPAPMGTFQRDGPEWKQVRTTSGPPPVTVGKALASGSSSLLAAMAEEQRHSGPPPMWPGGPPLLGWRPPPGLEHQPPPEWMHGRYPPSPAYYPPPFRPPFSAGAPPPAGPPPGGLSLPAGPPVSPFAEVRPPGFWGDRNRCSQPPTGWEGASSAPMREPRRRSRERSRSKRRRRKG